MEINRTISLSTSVEIDNKIVANLNANIGGNGSYYSISVNFVDKELINLTEANKSLYDEQYNTFVDSIKQYI
jgi:hypothetical protein